MDASTLPPPPWRYTALAVGGLWAVGFGPGSDVLLVLSVNGRGAFDCSTAQRVARDRDVGDFDPATETVTGIGPLAGTRVPLCGTGGGVETQRTLPLSSEDGWSITVVSRTSPHDVVA